MVCLTYSSYSLSFDIISTIQQLQMVYFFFTLNTLYKQIPININENEK